MKPEIGMRVVYPNALGGVYIQEIIEITTNLIAVRSVDYPSHPIGWYKKEDFFKKYHVEGIYKHDCKCWSQ